MSYFQPVGEPNPANFAPSQTSGSFLPVNPVPPVFVHFENQPYPFFCSDGFARFPDFNHRSSGKSRDGARQKISRLTINQKSYGNHCGYK